MTLHRLKFSIVMAVSAMLGSAATAQTQQKPACHVPTAAQAARAASSGFSIPDVKVKTQDGRTVNFYSDLLKGKIVAVNFVFTTCTTVCPPMGALFKNLQDLNRERVGKDVHLVSVSIDPVVDTPERLKAWGNKFGARPGWTLVTGEKADITKILKAMNVYVANFTDHQPVTLIGNELTGEWKRSYGFTSGAKLTALLNQIGATEGAGR